jgi:hypothetical protein
MVTIEELAQAALRRDNLQLRSLAQDFLLDHPQFESISRPLSDDQRILGVAAGLLELLAQRSGRHAPAWTREIGSVPEPFYLLDEARRMKRLRRLCETESPEPLRKRGLYAPPGFLSFA